MSLDDTISNLGSAIVGLVDRKIQDVNLENYYTKAETETLVDDTLQDLNDVLAGGGSGDGIGFALNDLSNLNEAGIAVIQSYAPEVDLSNTLNNNQITNCVLETPHMVDLELYDVSTARTWKTKAGSKFIIPYGKSAPAMSIGDNLGGGSIVDISWDEDNLFYIIQINEDKENNFALFGNYVYGAYSTTDDISKTVTILVSGDTPPTQFLVGVAMWYDTANNIVKHTSDSGATWENYLSFPFVSGQPAYTEAGPTPQNNGWLNGFDQIFQHIGYVGTTVWCMKGVKALCPNGRNSDGTLKNIEITTDSVKIANTLATLNMNIELLSTGILSGHATKGCFIQNNQPVAPIGVTNGVWYNPIENIIRITADGGNSWGISSRATLGSTITSTAIDELKVNSTFQAIDKNDTEFIAHQAMPSDRYIDLTLGSSGATYIAPADGYFTISKNGTSGQFLGFWSSANGLGCWDMIYANTQLELFMPAKKGDKIAVNYSASGTLNRFRFVYAGGAY